MYNAVYKENVYLNKYMITISDKNIVYYAIAEKIIAFSHNHPDFSFEYVLLHDPVIRWDYIQITYYC
mgnify:CR=1 FL=1